MKLVHLLQLIDRDRMVEFWIPDEENKETQEILCATPADVLYKIDPKWFTFPATIEHDEKTGRITIKLIL